MPVRYDEKTDTIHIILGPEIGNLLEYRAGPFSVFIDESDSLVRITIRNAQRFIARVLAAGFKAEGLPDGSQFKREPVWEDVESSMISAFKYDEATGTLDVAFKRSGVYRYYDVPEHVVEGLRKATSKGGYMRSMIIDMYPWEKLG